MVPSVKLYDMLVLYWLFQIIMLCSSVCAISNKFISGRKTKIRIWIQFSSYSPTVYTTIQIWFDPRKRKNMESMEYSSESWGKAIAPGMAYRRQCKQICWQCHQTRQHKAGMKNASKAVMLKEFYTVNRWSNGFLLTPSAWVYLSGNNFK